MPQFGTIKRLYPRIEVPRGFNPNEPHTQSAAHPVKSGVIILSGQVVTKVWNATINDYEWELGWVAGRVPHYAYNDSADENIIEAGKLVALSCVGQFEIQTAFFKADDTYNDGVHLSPDGVTGSLKAATLESAEPICGIVSKIHGPLSLAGKNSNVVNLNVIQFQTVYLSNTADAT
jgi:hypothetical protein